MDESFRGFHSKKASNSANSPQLKVGSSVTGLSAGAVAGTGAIADAGGCSLTFSRGVGGGIGDLFLAGPLVVASLPGFVRFSPTIVSDE